MEFWVNQSSRTIMEIGLQPIGMRTEQIRNMIGWLNLLLLSRSFPYKIYPLTFIISLPIYGMTVSSRKYKFHNIMELHVQSLKSPL